MAGLRAGRGALDPLRGPGRLRDGAPANRDVVPHRRCRRRRRGTPAAGGRDPLPGARRQPSRRGPAGWCWGRPSSDPPWWGSWCRPWAPRPWWWPWTAAGAWSPPGAGRPLRAAHGRSGARAGRPGRAALHLHGHHPGQHPHRAQLRGAGAPGRGRPCGRDRLRGVTTAAQVARLARSPWKEPSSAAPSTPGGSPSPRPSPPPPRLPPESGAGHAHQAHHPLSGRGPGTGRAGSSSPPTGTPATRCSSPPATTRRGRTSWSSTTSPPPMRGGDHAGGARTLRPGAVHPPLCGAAWAPWRTCTRCCGRGRTRPPSTPRRCAIRTSSTRARALRVSASSSP